MHVRAMILSVSVTAHRVRCTHSPSLHAYQPWEVTKPDAFVYELPVHTFVITFFFSLTTETILPECR